MIQSSRRFAHVTTAKLSWHVQICDLIKLLFFKLSKIIFFRGLDYELINHM